MSRRDDEERLAKLAELNPRDPAVYHKQTRNRTRELTASQPSAHQVWHAMLEQFNAQVANETTTFVYAQVIAEGWAEVLAPYATERRMAELAQRAIDIGLQGVSEHRLGVAYSVMLLKCLGFAWDSPQATTLHLLLFPGRDLLNEAIRWAFAK